MFRSNNPMLHGAGSRPRLSRTAGSKSRTEIFTAFAHMSQRTDSRVEAPGLRMLEKSAGICPRFVKSDKGYTVTEFVSELWARLTLHQPTELSRWQWLIVLTLVLLLVLPHPVWRLTGMYSTLVHELGHVISALFTGRFVTGLRLGWDHSGEVVSRGRGKFSIIISGIFGYPAPVWLAAGLFAAAAAGYSGVALGIYALFFCLCLIFVRNLAALVVCVASALIALGLVLFAPVEAFTYATLLLAGFLFLAGLRDCLKLLSVHLWRRRDIQNSDAYLIAQATGTFATFWLVVILALAGTGAWLAVRSLLRLI